MAGVGGGRCGTRGVDWLRWMLKIAAMTCKYVLDPAILLHLRSYNFSIPVALGEKSLHHITEFGWMIYQHRTSILKKSSLDLR